MVSRLRALIPQDTSLHQSSESCTAGWTDCNEITKPSEMIGIAVIQTFENSHNI